MAKKEAFEAQIQTGDRGGAFVEVPEDRRKHLGPGRRIPVLATFDGEIYRGSLVAMGGIFRLGFTKTLRAATGKEIGDRVSVTVERDDTPRTVEVPQDLADALAAVPGLRTRFDTLAYTYRKEYARWISGAKRAETRERRLRAAVEKISEGKVL